jgi:hypothetical protein
MKYFLYLFLFVIMLFQSQAQDLIVTTKQDSIKCKILEVDSGRIKYAQQFSSRSKVTYIDTDEVKEYVRDFYTSDVIAGETEIRSSYQQTKSKKEKNEKDSLFLKNRFNFNLDFGYAYRYARVSDDLPFELKQYFDDMRWGPQISACFNYYFWDDKGLGFQYSKYMQSNDLTTTEGIKLMSDDISLQTYSASYIERYYLFKKSVLATLGVSLGYVSYYNDAYLEGNKIEITGNTFSYGLDATIHYFIADNMSIGPKINLFQSILRKVEYKHGSNTEKAEGEDNMGRIGVGVFFQIHFK